jgi:hypothetical protein
LQFWRDYLSDLTVGYVPPDRIRGDAANALRTISVEVTGFGERLDRFARGSRTSRFATCLTSFMAVLSERSGNGDITTSTFWEGRDFPGSDELVGYFLNVLSVRAEMDLGTSFGELLAAVHASLLSAFKYAVVPIIEIMADQPSLPETMTDPTMPWTIFQVISSASERGLELDGVDSVPFPIDYRGIGDQQEEGAPFPQDLNFTIELGEKDGGVLATYNAAIYDSSTIAGVVEDVIRLSEVGMQAPDRTIRSLLDDHKEH